MSVISVFIAAGFRGTAGGISFSSVPAGPSRLSPPAGTEGWTGNGSKKEDGKGDVRQKMRNGNSR